MKKTKKETKQEFERAKKTLKSHNRRTNIILKKQENIMKEYEKQSKKLDRKYKDNKEKMKKMKKTNMWVGLIMGLVTIILVSTIVIREFMSATPNLLVIVIDFFAFFMSINLIYQSYKTRNELRKQIQEELLDELEKD